MDFPGGSSSSLPVQYSGQQTVSMRFTETLLLQRFTIDVKQFIPLPDKRKFNGLDRTYCPYPKELNSDEQGNLQSEDSLETEEDSNIAFKANAKRTIEVKSVQSVGAVGKRAKVQADTSEVTSNQSIENAAEEVYPSYPWHYLTGLSYRDLTNAYAQSDDQIFIKNLLNIQNSDFLMSSSSSNNSCQIIQSNIIVLYQFVSAGLSRLRYASLTAACHCYYRLKHLLRPLKQSYTSCLPLSPLLRSDVSAQSCSLTASASGCLHSTCLLMSLLPPPVHPPLTLWLMVLLDPILNNCPVIALTRCDSSQCARCLLCVSQSMYSAYRVYLVSSTHHGYVFNLYSRDWARADCMVNPRICYSFTDRLNVIGQYVGLSPGKGSVQLILTVRKTFWRRDDRWILGSSSGLGSAFALFNNE
ncbi:hypothetical protein MP228_000360 [Amoeboaphelidium protococcarum]|nr:hypothetical protein MP228_000360 [Amoeboaphelidium protococcarum]